MKMPVVMTVFDEIIAAHQQGEARGIPSICSSHPTVLRAALQHAREHDTWVLIESTCNQVNQFGGYTGMVPADFMAFIQRLAGKVGFPTERLILGGDHLGPEVWQQEPSRDAMEKARKLVWDYVSAGYTKIHLDASMKLGGDPPGPLSPDVAADRSAQLAQSAEDAFAARGFGIPPRYVIGTEVPIPGGARQAQDHRHITAVADAAQTLEISRRGFRARGLESAWERVIALVVHPGVEFGNDFVLEYDRSGAASLSDFISGKPLVYEAHSTDYQIRERLRQMVDDHFAILKVGPALTFAYREAVFALAEIERELYPSAECSELVAVVDQVMVADPTHWQKYYPGDSDTQQFARKYSYSDRVRYYWTDPDIQAALSLLLANLGKRPIPLSLVSQYLPVQYWRMKHGHLANDPLGLIRDKINDVLQDYKFATDPKGSAQEE